MSGRTAKQEQEQISPNHVPTIFHFSVEVDGLRLVAPENRMLLNFFASFPGKASDSIQRPGSDLKMGGYRIKYFGKGPLHRGAESETERKAMREGRFI